MTEHSSLSENGEYRFRLRELDFATAYHILLEKFWLVVASVAAFILLGLVYITLSTRIYEATATLGVDESETPVITMNPTAPDTGASLRDADVLKTIEHELSRRSLLIRVLKRPEIRQYDDLAVLATSPESASNDDALERLSKQITVRQRRGSRLIDITVQNRDPMVAKLLANSLANEYILEMVMRRSGYTSETADFLDKEGDKMKSKLDENELGLQDLKVLVDIHARVLEVQKDIGDLNKRYLAKHPKLISAQNLLKDLRSQFITEMTRRNIVPAEFEPSVTVGVALSQPEKLDREMARQESRYNVMVRDLTTDRSVYEAVLQRRKERGVTGASAQVAVHVVEPATIPSTPTKPRKLLVLALCLFGGGLTGVVLAFWLNSLDSSLKTVDEAEEYLRLTLLGALPERGNPNRQKLVFEAPFGSNGVEHVIEDGLRESIPIARRYFNQSKQFTEEMINKWRKTDKVAPQSNSRKRNPRNPKKNEGERPLVMLEDPSSLLAESFRNLRAGLKLLGAKEERKTFLFSSAVPAEGKSFTSANFALSLAQEGARTLFIEADLRKPTAHRTFKVSTPVRGVTDYLTGQGTLDELVIHFADKNLDLLLAGSLSPNPAELLSAGGFTRLLEEASRKYDRIVIDSAPILAVSDTLLISNSVQTMCLVVRAGSTPREAVGRAIRLLRNYGAPLSGFVLNRLPLQTGFGSNPYYYYYQAGEQYGEVYGSSRKT